MEGKKYLGDLVKQYHERSGLSYSQIEKKTGVPAKTVTSWARGLSKRPRRWQDLVSFAAGLGLLHAEVDELLDVTRHPSISELRKSTANEADQELLSTWNDTEPIFQIRRRTVNYFGREEAQKTVKAALQSKEQLCVIEGMGGVGKSTLAIEIASHIKNQYRDGVLWGDLRLMSNDEILDSWANLIGLQFPQSATSEAKATNMWGVLSRKSFLIVLDDAISLTRVKHLLPPHETECGLLVTTRDKAVASGIVTDPANIVSLQPMRPETSMDLIKDILGAEFTSKHAETLCAIATLLGHLPLALNIYARRQRLTNRPPQSLLDRMQDIRLKLDHLKMGDEAVRTAFEQSWELLGETTQTGFKQMAVFEGREFGIEAFTEIGQFNRFEVEDILEQLQQLFLVESRSEKNERFQQHTLLAAWSHDLISIDESLTADEKNSPYQRMGEYYLQYAILHLDDPDSGANLAIEWPNIMGGMKASSQVAANKLVLKYLDLLEPYWLLKGYYTDARLGYRYGINSAEQLQDETRKAWLQLARGSACIEQSDYVSARIQLSEAKTYMISQNISLGIGKTNLLLADIELFQGQFLKSENLLKEAWQEFQKIEDIENLSSSMLRMGNTYYDLGKFEEAIDIWNGALKAHTQFKNPLEEMRCLTSIAMGLDELGKLDESEPYFERLKLVSEKLESRIEISEYYYAYAYHLSWRKDFDNAAVYGEKSRQLFLECGDQLSEANTLNILALIYLQKFEKNDEKDDLLDGKIYAEQSLLIYKRAQNMVGVMYATFTQGKILISEGEKDQGYAKLRESQKIAINIGNQYYVKLIQDWIDRFYSLEI